jgi:HEAT repeat protein
MPRSLLRGNSLQAMATRDPDHQNRQIDRQALEAILKRAASTADKKHQARIDLLTVMVDPQRSWEERLRAKASLIRIGDETLIPELDQALKASRDDQVRVDIVEVLAELPACHQLQTTLLAYLHQALPVRRRAIVALGEIGDEKAIYYLNEAAREGDQPGQLLTLEDSRLARKAVQRIHQRTG